MRKHTWQIFWSPWFLSTNEHRQSCNGSRPISSRGAKGRGPSRGRPLHLPPSSRKLIVREICENSKGEQPWGRNTSCTPISGDQAPVGAHWASSRTVFSSKSAKSSTKSSICAFVFSTKPSQLWSSTCFVFCLKAGGDQPGLWKCQPVIASTADVSPVW